MNTNNNQEGERGVHPLVFGHDREMESPTTPPAKNRNITSNIYGADADDFDTFEIIIRKPDGEVLRIKINDLQKVKELKRSLSMTTGISVNEIDLKLYGKGKSKDLFEDDKYLYEY